MMSILSMSMLVACTNETRPVGPDLPQTAPASALDPRIEHYQGNAYQVSQGGRYYLWYGCASCHAAESTTGPDLGSGQWRHGRDFDAVYAFIAHAHSTDNGTYDERIPAEQLWQLTAYVRSLPDLDPQKRRRQDLDTFAEPGRRHGPQGR